MVVVRDALTQRCPSATTRLTELAGKGRAGKRRGAPRGCGSRPTPSRPLWTPELVRGWPRERSSVRYAG